MGRLNIFDQAALLFAKESYVAFTKNRAEQDLRKAKVKKVSGCFITVKYVEAYCQISSYLQSMVIKGHNPLIAIQMVLAGEDISPKSDRACE